MPMIPFTQYLRPNGRRVLNQIERPADIAAQAAILVSLGYRFEIEVLTSGKVSMTVEDGENPPISMEVCDNGPTVPTAVDKLIHKAIAHVNQG